MYLLVSAYGGWMSGRNGEAQDETLTERCRKVSGPAGTHSAGCRPCFNLGGIAERHRARRRTSVSVLPIAHRDADSAALSSPRDTDTLTVSTEDAWTAPSIANTATYANPAARATYAYTDVYLHPCSSDTNT